MTISQDKSQQLEDRTVNFSVMVIKTLAPYAKNPVLSPIINQVIRSSSSVGANYAEANNASSKADFRNKIFIAKKEVAETRYWLRILEATTEGPDFSSLKQEALELNLIFQKIISTLKIGK